MQEMQKMRIDAQKYKVYHVCIEKILEKEQKHKKEKQLHQRVVKVKLHRKELLLHLNKLTKDETEIL